MIKGTLASSFEKRAIVSFLDLSLAQEQERTVGVALHILVRAEAEQGVTGFVNRFISYPVWGYSTFRCDPYIALAQARFFMVGDLSCLVSIKCESSGVSAVVVHYLLLKLSMVHSQSRPLANVVGTFLPLKKTSSPLLPSLLSLDSAFFFEHGSFVSKIRFTLLPLQFPAAHA